MSSTQSGGVCFTHPDKELILVCTSCSGCYVCVKCITSTHLYHNCIEIDEYLDSVQQERHEKQNHQELKRQANLTELTLSSMQRQNDVKMENEDIQFDQTDPNEEHISIRSDKEGQPVDYDIIHRLTNDQLMDENEISHTPSLADEIASCEESELAQMMASSNIGKKRNIDFPTSYADEIEKSSLTSECEDDKAMCKTTGNGNEKTKQTCLKEISSLNVGTSYIRSLSIADNDNLWFASCDMELKKLFSGSLFDERIYIDSVVLDVSCTSTGDAVWVCCSDRTIREKKNNELPEIRFFTKSVPLCLGILPQGDIVCGFTTGHIIRYKQDGCVVFLSDLDSTKCSEPYKLSICNKTCNIAVVDRSGDMLIILDEELNFKFIHNRRLGHNSQLNVPDDRTNFCPWDVCYNSEGNLVVADYGGGLIFVIDGQTGRFMQALLTGVEYPTSITISSNAVLWIGYETGVITSYKSIV